VVNVNLKGNFNVLQTAGQLMTLQGSGKELLSQPEVRAAYLEGN